VSLPLRHWEIADLRTVFSTVLKDKYNLTELQIGLCYLYVLLHLPDRKLTVQTIGIRIYPIKLPKWSAGRLPIPQRSSKSRRRS